MTTTGFSPLTGHGVGSLPVVDRVKQYILTNRLSPGDPLPTEKDLSEQLAVSRSRIREAMKVLSALDIVEVRHGYGTFVGRMSLTAMVESLAFRGMLSTEADQHILADLVDLRELLETSLADVVVHQLSPESALTMRQLAQAMVEKAASGQEFPDEDRQFHHLLMASAGNSLAVQLLDVFWQVHTLASDTLGPATDLPETADGHLGILDAIDAGDAEQVRQAIRTHYVPIRRRMERQSRGL